MGTQYPFVVDRCKAGETGGEQVRGVRYELAFDLAPGGRFVAEVKQLPDRDFQTVRHLLQHLK